MKKIVIVTLARVFLAGTLSFAEDHSFLDKCKVQFKVLDLFPTKEIVMQSQILPSSDIFKGWRDERMPVALYGEALFRGRVATVGTIDGYLQSNHPPGSALLRAKTLLGTLALRTKDIVMIRPLTQKEQDIYKNSYNGRLRTSEEYWKTFFLSSKEVKDYDLLSQDLQVGLFIFLQEHQLPVRIEFQNNYTDQKVRMEGVVSGAAGSPYEGNGDVSILNHKDEMFDLYSFGIAPTIISVHLLEDAHFVNSIEAWRTAAEKKATLWHETLKTPRTVKFWEQKVSEFDWDGFATAMRGDPERIFKIKFLENGNEKTLRFSESSLFFNDPELSQLEIGTEEEENEIPLNHIIPYENILELSWPG